MPRLTASLATLLLCFCLPAGAWNDTGHKAVAAIAYDLLTPAAKTRVIALLRAHPDYQALAGGAADPDRAAFLAAATWPDIIKGDARFYDEARRNATPTPLLAGFPDMKQHRNWHYTNIPYSPLGAPVLPPPEPSVLTELRRLIGKQLDPYDLPWLLHLAGDVHQPLHTTARFLEGQVDRDGKPSGDQGGNLVWISSRENLHWYWDGLLGSSETEEYLAALVKSMRRSVTPEKPAQLDPEVWAREGFAVAKETVYSFGHRLSSKENPVSLSDAYKVKARRVAQQRAAVCGYRLGALLNTLLK